MESGNNDQPSHGSADERDASGSNPPHSVTEGNAAALLVWGMAVGNADEFRSWHNQEHLPERAAVSGFRRSRRFRSLEGELEFLSIYEATSASVFAATAYTALLQAPSAWTRAILSTPAPGVARTIGETRFSVERGMGGLIGVWRFDSLPLDGADRLRAVREEVLPAFASHPAFGALRMVESIGAAGDTDSTALKAISSIVIPHAVIIAEGWSSDEDLREACMALSKELPFEVAPPCRYYRMEVLMTENLRFNHQAIP